MGLDIRVGVERVRDGFRYKDWSGESEGSKGWDRYGVK